MNVLQVLAITTTAYFMLVAVWILKMEDFLEQREERQYESDTSRSRGEA